MKCDLTHKLRSRRHGLALILVLALLAAAALIGWAMLSSASLQAQIGGSAQHAAQADDLSESAVQTAMYYVQNPAKMPASWAGTGTYTMYAHGVALPGASGGTFDLEVAPGSKPCVYNINAVGYSAGSTGLSRAISASIQAFPVTPDVAVSFAGSAIIPARHTITGPVVCDGVSLEVGTITGLLQPTISATDYVVPTAATINYYGGDVVGGTYMMPDGTTGKPDILSSNTLAVAPTASATNPGKVFYYGGSSLTITSPMTIIGTLVVRGALRINPSSGSVIISAQNGFPALVLDDQLQIAKSGISLQVNGVSWLGNGTAWTLTTLLSTVTFNGAVLFPAGKGFGACGVGSVSVNYDPTKVNVTNLTRPELCVQPVLALKTLTWRQ